MSFTVKGYDALAKSSERWLASAVASRQEKYQRAGTSAISEIAGKTIDFLVARGRHIGMALASLAPLVDGALGRLAASASTSSLSFTELGTVDVYGAMAASGVTFAAATAAAAREIPKAILTSRDDEYPHHHWRRGFIGLALEIPSVYRGIAGFELNETIAFEPNRTFGPNVQGFLAHLAGAVEQRAPVETCLAAWTDFALHSELLRQAKMFQTDMFLWAAWVLHHRIAGQPLATVADWMHDSLYRLAGEAA